MSPEPGAAECIPCPTGNHWDCPPGSFTPIRSLLQTPTLPKFNLTSSGVTIDYFTFQIVLSDATIILMGVMVALGGVGVASYILCGASNRFIRILRWFDSSPGYTVHLEFVLVRIFHF